MKKIIEMSKEFLQNKIFIVCVIVTSLLSFGFGVTHVSIGIDDLCFDRYVTGTWILSANRWGTWLLYNLLKIYSFTPFWLEFITVLIYIITSLVMCSATKIVSNNKIDNRAYLLLACGYISFPILSYQFLFQSTNISVALSNFLVVYVACLIFINYQNNGKKSLIVLYGIVLGFSIACYESCLQTYIVFALILILIWIKYSSESIQLKDITKICIVFLLNIIIAINIYCGIAVLEKSYLKRIDKLTTNAAYHRNIFDVISVEENDFISFIVIYIKGRFSSFFEKKPNQTFMLTLMISTMLFILCNIYDTINKKRVTIIFITFIIVISNLFFFLGILKLLYRIYYSWAIMIGFEYLFIFDTLINFSILKKYKIDRIIFSFFLFVILLQTKETNSNIVNDWLFNEKAKNESILIGNTIENYCDDPKKPIIYEFKYNKETEEYVLEWAVLAFNDPGTVITQYINYYGFDLINANKKWDIKVEESEDYKDRKIINKSVSEGKKYIYVKIN